MRNLSSPWSFHDLASFQGNANPVQVRSSNLYKTEEHVFPLETKMLKTKEANYVSCPQCALTLIGILSYFSS